MFNKYYYFQRFSNCFLIVYLLYIEYKQELTEINKKIISIDENINPMRSNVESVKNKLKGLTGKIYGMLLTIIIIIINDVLNKNIM